MEIPKEIINNRFVLDVDANIMNLIAGQLYKLENLVRVITEHVDLPSELITAQGRDLVDLYMQRDSTLREEALMFLDIISTFEVLYYDSNTGVLIDRIITSLHTNRINEEYEDNGKIKNGEVYNPAQELRRDKVYLSFYIASMIAFIYDIGLEEETDDKK